MTKLSCFNFMGHTTGAWEIWEPSVSEHSVSNSVVVWNGEQPVAQVYGAGKKQAEINAQLIAKAPELCERLERVESMLEALVGGDYAGHESYEAGLVWCYACHTKWEWSYNEITKHYGIDPCHTAKCKIAIGKQLLGLPVNIREEE